MPNLATPTSAPDADLPSARPAAAWPTPEDVAHLRVAFELKARSSGPLSDAAIALQLIDRLATLMGPAAPAVPSAAAVFDALSRCDQYVLFQGTLAKIQDGGYWMLRADALAAVRAALALPTGIAVSVAPTASAVPATPEAEGVVAFSDVVTHVTSVMRAAGTLGDLTASDVERVLCAQFTLYAEDAAPDAAPAAPVTTPAATPATSEDTMASLLAIVRDNPDHDAAAAALLATHAAALRCDCGAPRSTRCWGCAVAEYQAEHPTCAMCCASGAAVPAAPDSLTRGATHG